MLSFLAVIPGCGVVGVRKARAEIGARIVGGRVTWFPHPEQTHPDFVFQRCTQGRWWSRGCQSVISDLSISIPECSFGTALVALQSLYLALLEYGDPTWLSTEAEPKQAIWKPSKDKW